jgi:hypothetical protein
MIKIVKQGWISQTGTLREMHEEERDPTLFYLSAMKLSGQEDSQYKRFPVFIHDMSFHDVIKVGVWCVLWAQPGVRETPPPLPERPWIHNDRVWIYAFLQHGIATDHTTNNSMSFRRYSLFTKYWIFISFKKSTIAAQHTLLNPTFQTTFKYEDYWVPHKLFFSTTRIYTKSH